MGYQSLSGHLSVGLVPKAHATSSARRFLADLYADWVEKSRCHSGGPRDVPRRLLKVVASILPKQLEIERDPFDGVTDDQLAAFIAAARDALGIPEKFEGEKDEAAH
jgi:hypothetical protein